MDFVARIVELYLLVRGIMTNSLLQSLAYALCGDCVEVAGAKDLVNDDGVGSLHFSGERI